MFNFKLRQYYFPGPGFSLSFYNETDLGLYERNWETIEEMDMAWQPVQENLPAISFLIVRVLLVLVGEFLQISVLKMAKKEKGACENIIKLFVYVQMVYWPLEVVFITTTDWIHPLHEIFGSAWICDLFFFVKYSALNIILFHSFIVALVRYLFIIHYKFVDRKGKDNIKQFFFWIIILVAFVCTLWKYFGGGELDSDPYVNKCRGKYHVEFLKYENAMEGIKAFCDKKYDTEDIWSYWTAMTKRVSCIASSIIFILMGMNITEGFLYLRIIFRTKRYVALR